MKKIALIGFLLVNVLFIFAQEHTTYSKVKIYTETPAKLQQISQLGIALDGIEYHKGAYCFLELSSSEMEKLRDQNIQYEIVIEDLTQYYTSKNSNVNIDSLNTLFKMKGSRNTTPTNFHLGSMGGYLTYNEIITELHEMHQLYPDLISDTLSFSSTTTQNGNRIFYVVISTLTQPSIEKAQVLYTALTHAREPAGMQQMIYHMWYLLENYATNPEIQYLMNNLELFFVPCLNPDGYIFNQTQQPNGGGMWRKNRRNNGNNTWGVDLNRNFGYNWGYDNVGSSINGNDETYRGTAGFSEVETQQLKLFIESQNIKLAMSNHCHGNLLIYPWGYIPALTTDSLLFIEYAKLLTTENNFVYGTCYEVLNYTANGGSSDWFYGEQTTKNKIIEFSPEAGDPLLGFWPPAINIEQICEDYLPMNMSLMRLGLPYAKMKDLSSPVISSVSAFFNFEIKSLGYVPASNFTISLNPISSNILSVGNPILLSTLNPLDVRIDSISIQLQSGLFQGDSILFEVLTDNGMFIYRDTIVKFFGTLTTILDDPCNSVSNWTTNGWQTTTAQFVSPSAAITDSPLGNYVDNAYSYIELTTPIDLSSSVYAQIEFFAKWALETNFDYVQLFVSIDNGSTWLPISSTHSSVGSSFQDPGNPLYHGFQNDWVYEVAPLTDFLGGPIKIKFELISDGYLNFDGFTFDDFKVTKVLGGSGIRESSFSEISAFYDYVNQTFIVHSEGKTVSQKLFIYDGKGSLIYTISLDESQKVIDTKPFVNGLYIITNHKGWSQKLIKY